MVELSTRRIKRILRRLSSRSSASGSIVSGGWSPLATRSKIPAAWLHSPNEPPLRARSRVHPRIDITGLEAVIKTRYTYDTISWLLARCPGVRFVWIMGADNLRSFHRWQKWHKIAELVPIVVIDRLGPSLYAAASPAGNVLARFRIPEHDAAALLDRKPPVWAYLHGLKSPLSSTALRALRTQDGTPGRTRRKSSKSAKKPKRAKTGGKKRGKKAPKRKITAKSRRRPATKSRRRLGSKSRRRQGRKKSAR